LDTIENNLSFAQFCHGWREFRVWIEVSRWFKGDLAHRELLSRVIFSRDWWGLKCWRQRNLLSSAWWSCLGVWLFDVSKVNSWVEADAWRIRVSYLGVWFALRIGRESFVLNVRAVTIEPSTWMVQLEFKCARRSQSWTFHFIILILENITMKHESSIHITTSALSHWSSQLPEPQLDLLSPFALADRSMSTASIRVWNRTLQSRVPHAFVMLTWGENYV
jgi:hypothetical protein